MGKLLRKIADFIIKNIGQVFFMLLLIWVGMSIFLIFKWYFHKPAEMISKAIQEENFTPPESESVAQNELEELIKIIREPEPKEFYTAILGKGLFSQRTSGAVPPPKPGIETSVPSGPELEVLRITPVRIPLKYMGFLELPNGELSAQIDSSIVSAGDTTMDYKILEITKKHVKAARIGGGEIIFNLGEEVVSEESEAQVKDRKSGRVFRVKKGDMIDKKKVVDIKIGSVTLLNEDGTEEILTLKGR